MKNFVQCGRTISVAAPTGGAVSGDGIVVGSLFGVAATTADEGDPVDMAVEGVFELPKPTTTVFASCGAVSFDISTREAVAPGSGKYPIGVATEAAGNGAATVTVRLDGVKTAAA